MMIAPAPRLLHATLASPLGRLLLVHDAEHTLRALDFEDYAPRMERLLLRHYGTARSTAAPLPAATQAALEQYFAGDGSALPHLAIATGGTPFQRRIWAELRRIPFGTAISYRELAARVGAPAAMRAAGGANGANPLAIVVPCHRVIGANASLTGFGGGIARKAWLLRHEGIAFT